MKSRLFWLVLFVFVFGTLFFLFTQDPEIKNFTSDDGKLSLSALASSSAWVDIRTDGNAYLLQSVTVLSAPATLRLITDDLTQRLAFFDTTFGMWRIADTEVDKKNHALVTYTTQLNGRWRVLSVPDIARPNFDAEISTLLSAVPHGAVGYTLEIGSADASADAFILEGLTRTGGCAGHFLYTGQTIITSQQISFSDDRSYQLVTVWQMGQGCMGHEVIESSSVDK